MWSFFSDRNMVFGNFEPHLLYADNLGISHYFATTPHKALCLSASSMLFPGTTKLELWCETQSLSIETILHVKIRARN